MPRETSKWPTHEILPIGDWNFGLAAGAQLKVNKLRWPKDNFPFTLESVPLQIKVMGRQIPSWKIDQHGLAGVLPQSPVNTESKLMELTLIPMGAARLRISSFPQVKGA